MIQPFYTFGIQIFKLFFYVFTIFNSKAKKRIDGLKKQIISPSKTYTILCHCASAGEFEQVHSILKGILKERDNIRIVLSFYSASGIEWTKKMDFQYESYYLPFDIPSEVDRFLNKLNPQLVIITKNELWFNFLNSIQKRDIPSFLVAASFKKNHFAFKFKFFTNKLNGFKKIFLISELDREHTNGVLSNTQVAGDPRIDRIIEKSKFFKPIGFLFSDASKPVVTFASIHKKDIIFLKNISQYPQFNYLIVPHEVDEKSIKFFQANLPASTKLYSTTDNSPKNLIIVDRIGILASLYQYSTFTYIGGGLGKGVHNVLEPGILGNILFCGPKNENFVECRILKKRHALIEITKNDNFLNLCATLPDNQKEKMRKELSLFFEESKGTSEKISTEIVSYIYANN